MTQTGFDNSPIWKLKPLSILVHFCERTATVAGVKELAFLGNFGLFLIPVQDSLTPKQSEYKKAGYH